MKTSNRLLVVGPLIAFILLCAAPAKAQTVRPPAAEQGLPLNSFTISTTGTIANASLKGVTSDRRLFLVAASYNRLLMHRRAMELSFTTEAIPVAILREPFFTGSNIQSLTSISGATEPKSSFGVGANPLGAEISFLPAHRVQPLIGFQGGFLYFNRNVLFPRAAQFNLTLNGRAGVQIPLGDGRKVSLAYIFEHMSNAYMAVENPGLDLQMISVGYTFRSPFGKKRN